VRPAWDCLDRSIDFYTRTLTPLGITTRVGYDGNKGHPAIPTSKALAPTGTHPHSGDTP